MEAIMWLYAVLYFIKFPVPEWNLKEGAGEVEADDLDTKLYTIDILFAQ